MSFSSWPNKTGTKVLLGREYADWILLRGLFSLFFNEPEISDGAQGLKSLPKDLYSELLRLKKFIDPSWIWTREP